ncbi:MAG: DinB family protein, partial [Acidobacteria bacterium]|nr:DinB family protein [Acidobacteriota bacterium]
MKLTELLLPEFDLEMSKTLKSLERVPDDKLDWKPHGKSATMRWLAGHLANIPSWASLTIEKDSIDIAPPGEPPQRPAEPESRQAILDTFAANVAAARAAIAAASDEHLMQPWTLLQGGKTVFTMPKFAVLRGFVMNHI